MNHFKRTLFFLISIILVSTSVHAQSQEYLWAKSIGTTQNDRGTQLAADDKGNIYAVGTFSGATVDFGGIVLTNTGYEGSSDGYLVKYTPEGDVIWAKSLGGNGDERIYDVTTDENANVYITGLFVSANFSLGSLQLQNAGGSDVFIAKYDSTGLEIWAKSAGYTKSDNGARIKTDLEGHLYLTGQYSDSISFGNVKLKVTEPGAGAARFIAKYLYDGSIVWARSAPGGGYDCQLAVGLDGDVYIAAAYTNSVTFGATTLTTGNSNSDSYIVKYNISGDVVWAKSLGPNGYNLALALTADKDGNAYLAGVFNSQTIVFGSDVLHPSVSQTMYVVKYDAAGNPIWGRAPHGNNDEAPGCITTDLNGNIYIGGFSFSTTLTIGTIVLTKSSGVPSFLAISYDPLGNALWANWTNQQSDALGVTTDPFGNSYFTGSFYGPKLTFGSTVLQNVSNGNDDIFLVKIKRTIITANASSKEEPGIQLFPNPAFSSIQISTPHPANWKYKIYTSTGICITQSSFEGSVLEMELSDQARGIYYIQLFNEKEALKTNTFILE